MGASVLSKHSGGGSSLKSQIPFANAQLLAIVLAIEVFNRFHFNAPCLIQSSKLLTLTYTAGIPGVAAEQSTSEEGNKR